MIVCAAAASVNDTIAEEDEQQEVRNDCESVASGLKVTVDAGFEQEENKSQAAGAAGLSTTQIVVTACTPMVEDDEHMQNFETANQEEKEKAKEKEGDGSSAVESAGGESASGAGAAAAGADDDASIATNKSDKSDKSVTGRKETSSELEDEFVKLESLKESYA